MAKQRTTDDIEKDLAKAQGQYHAAAQFEPAPKLKLRSDAVKALQLELALNLAPAARACPNCEQVALGRQKTPTYTHAGRLVPALYEIYCGCGGRSQGASPEQAAASWNAGEYIAPPAPAPAKD